MIKFMVRIILVLVLSFASLPTAPAAGTGNFSLQPERYAGSADITLTTDVVFNTDSGMTTPPLGPGVSADVDASYNITAFTMHSLTVVAGAHISYTGSRALALLAKGSIVISGSINADGVGPLGGSRTQAGQGTGPGGIGSSGGGGGGGSFASQGGTGGNTSAPNSGGLPGINYGSLDLSGVSPFPQGSGGGHGAACNSNDTLRGGAGGGGIILVSLGTIDLSHGTVSAKGAGGPTAVSGNAGNAGGSGGAVLILSPAFVDSSATYLVSGGTGGVPTAGGCANNLGGGAGGGGGRITFVTGSAYSGSVSMLPPAGGFGAGTGHTGGAGGNPSAYQRPFQGLSAPISGTVGAVLSFGAEPELGSTSGYTWTFGDGQFANTPGSLWYTFGGGSTHAYSAPGTYTLTVTAVMSGTGVLSSRSAVLTISDAPIGGLSAANSSPTVLGHTTYLSASVSSGTSITYTWNYGDGAAGSGANAQHVYATPGLYTATVTATNSISTTSAHTAVSVLWANYLPLLRR